MGVLGEEERGAWCVVLGWCVVEGKGGGGGVCVLCLWMWVGEWGWESREREEGGKEGEEEGEEEGKAEGEEEGREEGGGRGRTDVCFKMQTGALNYGDRVFVAVAPLPCTCVRPENYQLTCRPNAHKMGSVLSCRSLV